MKSWSRLWTYVRTTAVNNGTAIVLALLFWIVVVLMLIFALAAGEREGNPFAVFFAAFGSVGQVLFAAVVSWIAWEQFRHNRTVDDRQLRIDTFEMRMKMFEDFAALRRRFALSRFDETVPFEFAAMAARMDLIFPSSVDEIANRLGERLFDLAEVSEGLLELEDAATIDIQARSNLRKRRTAVHKLVREANMALYSEIRRQLKLNID